MPAQKKNFLSSKISITLFICSTIIIFSYSSPLTLKTQLKKDLLNKESEVFLGKWEGFIEGKGGTNLQLVFEIVKNKDDTLQCFYSLPLQGLNRQPVQAFSIEGNAINITIPLVMFTYSGLIKEDWQTIEGVLKIDIGGIKLILKKVANISSLPRLQTPKKPYPYAEQDVKFANLGDDITLAGTLTYPESGGPFPAAILISGAGPQDRNEEGFGGHRFFQVLADDLTKRGIAVLRYDDRGVGESTGSQEKATSADLAEDVKAAFQFLKTCSFINPQKIGLIGHSEGGFIAQIVASELGEIAYIVLMAGPALPGKDIWLYQLKIMTKYSAFAEDPIKYYERIITILDKEQNDEKVREKISSIYKEMKIPSEMAKATIEYLLSPWMRYFIKTDPAAFLSKVKCPVLALGGKKDVHVPSSQNLKSIEEALQKAGNKNYEIVEFPNINHLFQTANTGLPMEYSLIEETIAPVVLQTIGDWIFKQVK